MSDITLFTGTDCHLCDLAKQMLEQVGLNNLQLTQVNVKEERQYYHQYGARIPVLRREATGAELGWPFEAQQLKEFLS